MKKENWIEDIMETANNMGRAEASTDLFTAIQSRLRGKVVQLKQVPARTVWLAAASLALLVALNFAVLTQTTTQTETTATAPYSLTDSNLNLY